MRKSGYSTNAPARTLCTIMVFIASLLCSLPYICIAETYEEDEPVTAVTLPESYIYMGAATDTFDIYTPPGRAGIQPKLTANYNSYRKNGWLGTGWDLSLGSIQRSTKRHVGYAVYDFVAERAGQVSELVSRSEWGSNFYGKKIEQGFAKYRFLGATLGWEVTTKDGIKRYYGLSENSRQYNPSNPTEVFRWCLERVEDTNGNYFVASYTKVNGEIYIDRIDYTGNSLTGELGRYHVLFEMEARSDEVRSYRTGFSVRTTKRLASIGVYLDDDSVTRYDFTYDYGPKTGESRLQSVLRTGADGITTLPATTFSWSSGGSGTFSGRTGFSSSGSGSSGRIAYVGDVNGDGLDDVVSQWRDIDHWDGGYSWKDYAQVYVSNGDGTFQSKDSITLSSVGNSWDPEPIEPMRLADVNGDGKADILMSGGSVKLATGNGIFGSTIGSSLGLKTLSTGDINGDGRIDVMGNYEKNSGNDKCEVFIRVGLSSGNGTFQKTADFLIASNIEAGDTDCVMPGRVEAHLADVSGDGYADLIIRDRDDRLETYLSQGDGTFSSASILGINRWADGVAFGDFNGDGLSDLIVNSSGYGKSYRLIGTPPGPNNAQVSIHLSLGNGTYASAVTRDYSFRSRSINVADVNGDGRADQVIGKYPSGICTLLARSDGTFGDEIHSASPDGGVITGDINGDGLADFLDYRGSLLVPYLANGNERADILLGITKWTGASTTIQYAPYSAFDYAPLPFMPNLVSSVAVNDGLGNISETHYWYSDAYFDYEDRSFRGFSRIAQTNPDETVVDHYYHQDDFRKGLKEKSILLDSEGTSLSETQWAWQAIPDSAAWGFVKLNSEINTYFDNPTVYDRSNYSYDGTNGNLLAIVTSGTEGEGVTTSFLHENFGEWLWRTTKESMSGSVTGFAKETYFEYENATGNLLAEEFRLDGDVNPRMDYGYDVYGNRVTVQNARGFEYIFEFDPQVHTYLVLQTNPKDHARTYEYDFRFGTLSAEIDPNNLRTEHDSDPFGRRSESRFPDGGRGTVIYYDQASPRYEVSRTLEKIGGETIDNYTFWDGLNRKIQTISHGYSQGPTTVISQWIFDNMGRNEWVIGPFYGTGTGYAQTRPAIYPYIQNIFDDRGRVMEKISPDGEYGTVSTSFRYSGFGTTTTDPDGGKKTEYQDYLGRTIEVDEFAGGQEWYMTTYAYDAVGNLLTVTNPLDHITSIFYDTMGRKTEMSDPDMGYWQYAYDANGNLETQTDAKDQIISFDHDKLDRPTTKSFSTSDPAVSYVYDEAVNGIGRLTSVSNTQVVKIVDSYDEMGRETAVTKSFAGESAAYTTRYDYDLAGRLSSLVFPDQYQVTYAYHPKSSLIHTVVGTTDMTDFASIDTYEPSGKIGRLTHGNAVETHYVYDSASTRLLNIATSDPSGLPLQDRTYWYTPAGDINEISLGDVAHVYIYDPLHRLKSEVTIGGQDQFYTVGLEMAFNDPNHVHSVSDMNMNGASFSYVYDANGNMIQGPDLADPTAAGTRTIDYNPENMPVRITTEAPIASFVTDIIYDGENKRAKKITAGTSTLYVNENFEINGGVPIKYIFAGNQRIAEVSSSGVLHYHKDHLGSTTVMTDTAGTPREQTEHLPFGGFRNPGAGLVSPYKFTDQEFDGSTELYNYDARLYDPVVGQFISADSIVPGDGYDPQSLNRYAYVRNNPLIYIDPSGHTYGSPSAGGEKDWGGEYADGSTNNESWGRAKENVAYSEPNSWGQHYDPINSYTNMMHEAVVSDPVDPVSLVAGGVGLVSVKVGAKVVAKVGVKIGGKKASQKTISTGRTDPKSLKEQLAMEEVKAKPKGTTPPRMPKMSDTKNNLHAKDGWAKRTQNVNGVEIHYVENTKTGKVIDFKFKD